MEVIDIPIGKLRHAEYNPRSISKHDFEQLKKSISSYGFVQPLVVNKAPGREGVIIGGNQRFEAAKALGVENVPVVWIQLEDLQKEKELNIRLNRNVGEWDWDILANEFEIRELLDIGFKTHELPFDDKKLKEETEPTPPVPDEARAKRGQLFTLGKHRLLCGDATKKEDYEKLLGGGKPRLVFTDPPYSVNYESQSGHSYGGGKYGGSSIFNDDKTPEQAMNFYLDILKNIFLFTSEDVTLYWWFANGMNWINRIAWIETGWDMSQVIIWVKESLVFSFNKDYHRVYEPCMLGWKKGNKNFSNKRLTNLIDMLMLEFDDFKDYLDMWYQKRDKTSEYVHPTQKPVGLAHRALRKNSVKGDLVMDVFGGSGSTLIGCEQMERPCRMMELDPKYVDVIIQRWCNFTGVDLESVYNNAVETGGSEK